MSDTYVHINDLLLTKDTRPRPDDLPTEGTFSPETGGGGKELKMVLLFKIANNANASATKVHATHPTALRFPTTQKSLCFMTMQMKPPPDKFFPLHLTYTIYILTL